MQTSVTKRGQTVIPAAIRKRYHIHEGDQIIWLDDGTTIRVVPTAADPIQALRGRGKRERLVERLLAARQADRGRERSVRLQQHAAQMSCLPNSGRGFFAPTGALQM